MEKAHITFAMETDMKVELIFIFLNVIVIKIYYILVVVRLMGIGNEVWKWKTILLLWS